MNTHIKTLVQNTLYLVALFTTTITGCSISTIRAEGPYLLFGPTDAPMVEILTPEKDQCEYLLERFYSVSRTSKCNASSAKLPFAGAVRNEFWGISLPISGRSMDACRDMLQSFAEGKDKGWTITEHCKQVGELLPAVAAAEPRASNGTPASKTEKPKRAAKKNAPSSTQSAPD